MDAAGKGGGGTAKNLIRKSGEANPMFGKKHSEDTNPLISRNMSKYPFGESIYDLDFFQKKILLLFTQSQTITWVRAPFEAQPMFNNNADLARHLNISRTTVGRYIETGKVFKKLYRGRAARCALRASLRAALFF